jgi:hypothetical protein
MQTMAVRVTGVAQLNNTTVGTIHATQLKVNHRTPLGGGNITGAVCDGVDGEEYNCVHGEDCDSGPSW